MQRVSTCSAAPQFSIIVLVITEGINGITHYKKETQPICPLGSGFYDHKALDWFHSEPINTTGSASHQILVFVSFLFFHLSCN